MNAGEANLEWSLCTSWPARGAIAVIQVQSRDDLHGVGIDDLLADLHAGPVAIGRVAVRSFAGIDTCVLARVDSRTLLVFPHAGRRILERITEAFKARGVVRAEELTPLRQYPEARDEIEARMLACLARAASPLAIDLLLDQPRRWRDVQHIGKVDPLTARSLARLVHPPLIAAIGPPNVGKSSLLNVLAGRSLAVVADAPGTTRDHVGATLDLGGLAVRWVDCPGFNPGEQDPLQLESQELAMRTAAAADLLVICGDAASGFPRAELIPAGPDRVWAALRSDLGPPPNWPPEGRGAMVSVRRQTGLSGLVTEIREALVPGACLKDVRAWRFWDLQEQDSRSM